MMRNKIKKLKKIYEAFQVKAQPYMDSAVCRIGCADCCTQVGEIYTTTLEGLRIQQYLKKLHPGSRRKLREQIYRNKEIKERQLLARCPLLRDSNTCAAYPVRPFTCRRLYSVRLCGDTGPVVHQELWEIAEETTRAVLALDNTGYSGHLSYILYLLDNPQFIKTYLSGDFIPEQVKDFACTHNILINRYAAQSESPCDEKN